MRDITKPYGLCTIDPISAVVGGIIPALFSGGGGGGSNPGPAPTPTPAPAPPPPSATPAPKRQSTQQSTFIGGVPAPPPQTSNKTLLGQ